MPRKLKPIAELDWIAILGMSISARDEALQNLLKRGYSLQELETFASSLAVSAAWQSEYLGYRGAYGCSDHGHDNAVKCADVKAKKVRKAIGYTYP